MSRSRFAAAAAAWSLLLMAATSSAVVVLGPSGQPFDFSHQVRNSWSGQCAAYSYWGSPWFVQAPECDRILLADATGLSQAGYSLSDAAGLPLDGLVLVSGGLTVQAPGRPPTAVQDGWEMLALFDDDGDGSVTANDPAWAHLRLFADEDGDSVLDAGEEGPMDIVSSLGTFGAAAYVDSLGNQRSDGNWGDAAGLPQPATDVVFAALTPQSFGGIPHYALGAADVTDTGSSLVVSNLGSSGCDGVSLDLSAMAGSSSQGASVTFVSSPPPTGSYSAVFTFTALASPKKEEPILVRIYRVFFVEPLLANAPKVLRFTPPSPGQAHVVVFDGDEIVAGLSTYAYEDLTADELPQHVSARPRCSPSSSDAYPCVETAAIELRWDTATSVTLPGRAPVTGDRVVVVGKDATESLSHVCAVDIGGSDLPAGSTIELGFPGIDLHGMELASVGNATFSSSPDGRLTIHNLGSMGLDGVETRLSPNNSRSGIFHGLEAQPAGGVSSMTLTARGVLGGDPAVRDLGTLSFTPEPAGGFTEVEWDYFEIQSPTATVELYAEGQLLQSSPQQTGPVFVLEPSLPTACGKVFVPFPPTLCFVGEWPDPVSMQLPGQPPVLADEIRVLAESPLVVESLETVALNVAAAAGGSLALGGVRNSLFGDPDFGIQQIVALGTGTVEPWACAYEEEIVLPEFPTLRVSNLGSSGLDGVRYVFDPAAGNVSVETSLPMGGTLSPGSVTRKGKKGNIEYSWKVEEGVIKQQAASVLVTSELSGLGGSNLRVRVWRDGVLRADDPVDSSGGYDLALGAWPSRMGDRHDVTPTGPKAVLTLQLPGITNATYTIAVGSKQIVSVEGDIVQLVSDTAVAPAPLESLDILASGIPYLPVDLIPAAPLATDSPAALLARSVLRPNAPNPFNPATTVSFGLLRSGPVALAVYGLDGRHVRDLVVGDLPAGNHRVTWDGTDARGRSVASGTYFLRLRTEGTTLTQKATLVK